MADFTNRNADETKQFILTFDENGGSPEYTKIEDANGVDRTAEVVELLGINDKEDADSTILKEGDVEDSLNSTSTTKPLSANQGKQLNDDKASLSVGEDGNTTWIKLYDTPTTGWASVTIEVAGVDIDTEISGIGVYESDQIVEDLPFDMSRVVVGGSDPSSDANVVHGRPDPGVVGEVSRVAVRAMRYRNSGQNDRTILITAEGFFDESE